MNCLLNYCEQSRCAARHVHVEERQGSVDVQVWFQRMLRKGASNCVQFLLSFCRLGLGSFRAVQRYPPCAAIKPFCAYSFAELLPHAQYSSPLRVFSRMWSLLACPEPVRGCVSERCMYHKYFGLSRRFLILKAVIALF